MRTIFSFFLVFLFSCSSIIEPSYIKDDKIGVVTVEAVIQTVEYQYKAAERQREEPIAEEGPCGLTCCDLEVACIETKKEHTMCRRTTCTKCNKPSYAGCGRHVDQVLSDVPISDRCTCKDDECEVDEAKCNNCPHGKKEQGR